VDGNGGNSATDRVAGTAAAGAAGTAPAGAADVSTKAPDVATAAKTAVKPRVNRRTRRSLRYRLPPTAKREVKLAATATTKEPQNRESSHMNAGQPDKIVRHPP